MIGETILHYKILEKLGEGGMGEVFKAQDTKLDRFVALKFLPSQLTASDEDKARFIQEAKAASSMNHPNVCTIYSIEEYNNPSSVPQSGTSEGRQLFISMEYVEGKTLKDKKDHLSEKQILEIGIQVAEGLAAAHEKGIVHRDIKPENIMVRKDGIVQIMDFGLAKLYKESNVSRLTKAGSTVGTMGYMSPEQVQGLDVDHRTDIFSLGVVLYELLTGELPFKGVHETAIMYEIVNVEPPPISTVKEGIDPELDRIILECLEKDKDERCQSAKELAKNLRKFKRASSGSKTSKIFQVRSFASKGAETLKSEPANFFSRFKYYVSRNRITTAIILLLTVVVIVLGFSKILQSSESNFSEPVHFSFEIPGKSSLILHWVNIFQVSPDGRTIVYTDYSGESSIIYRRDFNKNIPYPIRGTEGCEDPVFENNNWISFINSNYLLGKVPLGGGIADISGISCSDGFDWANDGKIILTQSWPSGLFSMSGWKENLQALTDIDNSKNEGCHLLPYVLPGNKAAVFTVWTKDGTFDDSKIVVVDFKTKERKNLSYKGVDLQGTSPRFIQAPWGNYLLWSKSGNLYASTFDLSALNLTGPAINILEGLSVNSESGRAGYSVTEANNGTIAYLPGKLDTAKTDLVWVDKNGNEKKAITTSGPYLMPMLSKSGEAIVVLAGPVYKIGIVNFEQNKVDLLWSNGDNGMPQITPDGSSFVFTSNFEDGKYNVYLSRLDGIGGVKKIVATEGGYPDISNISPDGKYILYEGMPTPDKIFIKDLTTDQKPQLLFKSDARLASPCISPDGKLVAYRSDEIDGKFKLFIRPFPINDTKIQVSLRSVFYPQWSADGSELYYREGDKITAAKIQTSPELKVISRRLIYESPLISNDPHERDFTVASDGRILILKRFENQSKPIKLNVIVNWFTELKNKLKTQD
jgi:serine/threonine protein kinase/Tol biopolymer transport system component